MDGTFYSATSPPLLLYINITVTIKYVLLSPLQAAASIQLSLPPWFTAVHCCPLPRTAEALGPLSHLTPTTADQFDVHWTFAPPTSALQLLAAWSEISWALMLLRSSIASLSGCCISSVKGEQW